ncbi:hypothetical protein SAMN06296378_1626 [Salinibacterium xinjiangense]|uniref:Uncharacterized protein n=1 Tax=Salinibacterium xinjiangense TaxID=386302 RepID=A0A2C8ZLE2_9MICO|nr:hypothetical protein SAMN06296378_1626 [Salinibacterium xinjiangense]
MTRVCARPAKNTPSDTPSDTRRRRMVVDLFVDERVSGSLASRPGLDELRAFASRDNTIVVRVWISSGVQPKICFIRWILCGSGKSLFGFSTWVWIPLHRPGIRCSP